MIGRSIMGKRQRSMIAGVLVFGLGLLAAGGRYAVDWLGRRALAAKQDEIRARLAIRRRIRDYRVEFGAWPASPEDIGEPLFSPVFYHRYGTGRVEALTPDMFSIRRAAVAKDLASATYDICVEGGAPFRLVIELPLALPDAHPPDPSNRLRRRTPGTGG